MQETGNNVRSIILKGVTIGRGAVVAAGTVVTKSVRPNAVVAGVPAKALFIQSQNKYKTVETSYK